VAGVSRKVPTYLAFLQAGCAKIVSRALAVPCSVFTGTPCAEIQGAMFRTCSMDIISRKDSPFRRILDEKAR